MPQPLTLAQWRETPQLAAQLREFIGSSVWGQVTATLQREAAPKVPYLVRSVSPGTLDQSLETARGAYRAGIWDALEMIESLSKLAFAATEQEMDTTLVPWGKIYSDEEIAAMCAERRAAMPKGGRRPETKLT